MLVQRGVLLLRMTCGNNRCMAKVHKSHLWLTVKPWPAAAKTSLGAFFTRFFLNLCACVCVFLFVRSTYYRGSAVYLAMCKSWFAAVEPHKSWRLDQDMRRQQAVPFSGPFSPSVPQFRPFCICSFLISPHFANNLLSSLFPSFLPKQFFYLNTKYWA